MNFSKNQPHLSGFFVGGKVMKNPERVAELLAELRSLAENNFEQHRINVLERDPTSRRKIIYATNFAFLMYCYDLNIGVIMRFLRKKLSPPMNSKKSARNWSAVPIHAEFRDLPTPCPARRVR